MQSDTRSAVSRLDHDAPHVRAARTAEQNAYDRYGLEYSEECIDVSELSTRIRAVTVGEGPPIVLIPGGEGMSPIWLPLLPELAEYSVYIMDRPGGGLSDGIDYRTIPLRKLAVSSTVALFDHFDLETAPVIGNSMGGLWSLRFALEHPDRVSKLGFLGCPAVYPGTSAPFPMRIGSISLLSGIIAEKMMAPDTVDDVRDAWKFLGHPTDTRENLPEEFAEVWYRMEQLPHYKQTWVGILQSVLRLRGANPKAAFTFEDLRNIRSTVLAIWGREDPFGSVEVGRSGAEHFQDAAFHEVGVGHLPWLDDPDSCGQLLREFLG